MKEAALAEPRGLVTNREERDSKKAPTERQK